MKEACGTTHMSDKEGGTERGDLLKIISRVLFILIFLAAPLMKTTPALAQETGTLILSAPEMDMFPIIRFQLDAYDSQGAFLDQLSNKNLQVIEDGQTIQPQAVEKITNGLQTIVVLNTSPVMGNNNGGITEYQRIQQHLIEWANAQKPGTNRADDYSLATPTGLFLIREESPAALAAALSQYQPDLTKTQPSLSSLTNALDLATDPLNQPFMKRGILYISPPLPASSSATLADLTKRAKGIGVRINVWQVTPGPIQSTDDPLRQLAEDSGGQYAEITPTSLLPEISPIFQPLRQTYQVTYSSTLKTSGPHRLSTQVTQGKTVIKSNEASLSTTIAPPNPIFIDPPVTIQRSWSIAQKDVPSLLEPEGVSLKIMIEFPDHHTRDLKVTRLYVDDVVVAENTSTPFDQFTWTMTDVTTSKRQTLRVEAVDVLDLSGSSIEVPVEIVIELPVKNSIIDRISSRGMIALGAMAAAGAVLALVMIFTGSRRKMGRKKLAVDRKAMKDPLTQPVPIRQDTQRPKKAQAGSAWTASVWPRPDGQIAPARLVALDDNEQPITGGILPLSRQEITFGSDPRRATQVLESPTVDGLHARLNRTAEGDFVLSDQNSVAGTWINYAPVTVNGARLEHGDLIHIGKVIFRFELTDPTRIPTIEVKVMDLEKPV
jgi:hypothetical protein